ncbi:hypothetical protein CMV_005003 [Castanea mollissima]|uniref:phosphogluconate dehydrogenase (NADP(+)-dependent, decarboxylating) n=1 Tax=Castanea mollissima TaxID=60419 RepID=A0A8J4W4K6_9ROSI|nr:hypothetical protein CMV_005003 [Castanea mollissima]
MIRAKSIEQGWGRLLGFGREAVFLDRIKKAYDRSRQPASLWIQSLQRRSLTSNNLLGEELSALLSMQALALLVCPQSSLAYFDTYTYRRDRLPANLVQAQRDYFGAHTYDMRGLTYQDGSFHTILNGSRLLNSQGSD